MHVINKIQFLNIKETEVISHAGLLTIFYYFGFLNLFKALILPSGHPIWCGAKDNLTVASCKHSMFKVVVLIPNIPPPS